MTFSWKLTINFLNKFSVWLFNTVQILCNACGTIDIPLLIYIGLPIFARLSSTLKADLLSCHSWRYCEHRKTGAMVPVLATLALYNSAIIYICVIQYFLAGFSSILEWQCNKNWLFYHPTSRRIGKFFERCYFK